jgi:hypothetical protein
MNSEQLELEMELLDTLLYSVENTGVICTANEIVDINRTIVITKPAKVYKVLMKKIKPFVFVSNKN